jgi:hypothetical protein
MNIRTGQIKNESEMVRDLKRKGHYSSGVPRPVEREEPKKAIRSPWPSRRMLQSMDEETFEQYIDDRERGEGVTP